MQLQLIILALSIAASTAAGQNLDPTTVKDESVTDGVGAVSLGKVPTETDEEESVTLVKDASVTDGEGAVYSAAAAEKQAVSPGKDYDYDASIEGKNDPELFDTRDDICEHCHCYNGTSSSLFIDCNNLALDRIPFWINELENLTDYILLDLSYNSLTEVTGFPKMTVWNLDLSHNSLRTIRGGSFQNLSNTLLQLDLSDNQLDVTSLEPDCFKGFESENSTSFKIIELSLARNRLHTVGKDLFNDMTVLTSLDLSENPLEPMSEELIQALQSIVTLQTLSLRSTALVSLPGELLTGLTQLTYLDLSGNRFTQVDPQLRLVLSLEHLVLDDNLIQVLDQGSFTGLTNIKNLSVSYNHNLRSIEAGTFKSLTNLQKLRISNNKQLEWISSEAWESDRDQALKLQELDLSSNHLKYLPSMLLHDFQDWKEIQVINIQGNPWWCDCHNEWLINTLVPMILEDKPELTQDITCGGPKDSTVIKESIVVVHDLTKTNELPCDTRQFDPSVRNNNMLDNKLLEDPRDRRQSLSMATTFICIMTVMATSGMVGMLYLQKSRREALANRRSFGRATGPRVGYRVASTSTPAGQPGIHTHTRGAVNTQYRDDDDEVVEVEDTHLDASDAKTHPYGRPQN